MPELSTTRRVQHGAFAMFDLVADVEHYPEFVPLCQSLRVRKRIQEGGKDVIVADMTVAYKLVRETFTSRVTLDRPNLEILVEYLEGPFRQLEQSLEFPRGCGSRLRCRFFHCLRIPQPHARDADGSRLRRRLPPFCFGLRAPRRSGLRHPAGIRRITTRRDWRVLYSDAPWARLAKRSSASATDRSRTRRRPILP